MSNAALLMGEEDLDTRPRKRRAKAPVPQEAAIQRAIIDWCRWRDIYAVHVPNAGKRSPIAARRLKGEGMRKGFPDLALYGRRGQHALLEVKRPGYTPSDVRPDQREMHDRLRERGITVGIVTSIEDAQRILRAAGWAV